MPNWCLNVVEIAHKDPAKLKAVVDAYNKGELCSYAIPVPQALRDTMAGSYGDEEKQLQLMEQEQKNRDTYGYANWYDFCVESWGTMWDCGGDGDHVELEADQTDTTFDFESAWAPPIGVYQALVEQGFEVRAFYYEPGMAFAGIWDNGQDDYYELDGMDSDQAREELPESLDEMFGIVGNMQEWEEEQEDDAE